MDLPCGAELASGAATLELGRRTWACTRRQSHAAACSDARCLAAAVIACSPVVTACALTFTCTPAGMLYAASDWKTLLERLSQTDMQSWVLHAGSCFARLSSQQ